MVGCFTNIRCSCLCVCISVIVVVIVFILVGLFVPFNVNVPDDPIFTVESTVVKAYNLTVENHLFRIINVGVRAGNRNTKNPTLQFESIRMELRKGKRHVLANDATADFSLDPLGEAVVIVEAVGMHVKLETKIAEELRADVGAGEGRVNVFLSGNVGSDKLRVACRNVVVDFSRSMKRVQMVGCQVEVIQKPKNDDLNGAGSSPAFDGSENLPHGGDGGGRYIVPGNNGGS